MPLLRTFPCPVILPPVTSLTRQPAHRLASRPLSLPACRHVSAVPWVLELMSTPQCYAFKAHLSPTGTHVRLTIRRSAGSFLRQERTQRREPAVMKE